MTSAIAPVPGPESILADAAASPSDGVVRWASLKSLWIGGMTLAAPALGPVFCSADAVLLFLVTSAITLCFGHSVGMHRRLIHRHAWAWSVKIADERGAAASTKGRHLLSITSFGKSVLYSSTLWAITIPASVSRMW